MVDSIGLPVVSGFQMVELGKFEGYDENGLLRSLNGRLTSLHKVLCSAAEIACKGRQDFYLGHEWLHDSHFQQNWSGNDSSL